MLSIAQSHLTLLLKDGRIFDSKYLWLNKLRSCPMCLGFWTSIVISVLFGMPESFLIVAGTGHVLYILREKYLPCDKCKVSEVIPFEFLVGPDEFQPDKKSVPEVG